MGDDDQAIYAFRGAAVDGPDGAERRTGHAPDRAADQPSVPRAHPGRRAATHPAQRPVSAGDAARPGQAAAGPSPAAPAPAGPGGRLPDRRGGGGCHRGGDRGAHRRRGAGRGLRGAGAHQRRCGTHPAEPGRAGRAVADRRGQPADGGAGGARPAGIPAGRGRPGVVHGPVRRRDRRAIRARWRGPDGHPGHGVAPASVAVVGDARAARAARAAATPARQPDRDAATRRRRAARPSRHPTEPAGNVLYGHLRRSGRYAGLVAAAERGDDGPLRRVAGCSRSSPAARRCSPTPDS